MPKAKSGIDYYLLDLRPKDSLMAFDKTMILGSCFATSMGKKMAEEGYDVCINPFGTIFNPQSIAHSVSRLISGAPFGPEDCVEMGAGAGKICSFSHHTSFARPSAEEFLAVANASLRESAACWKECDSLIITFGTAQVWRHGGETVSNCLKRPGYEFTHEMLSLEEIEECIRLILSTGKNCLFTVSPIRHLGEGAHVNTVSKSLLQVALARTGAAYFPSYEILLDELRDYSWYAADKVHPSEEATALIWERFKAYLTSRS